MDEARLGALLRMVRIRRGLRQRDVAAKAGVSDATVSRIERGHVRTISIGALAEVAAALEVRLDHRARWRGGDLEMLMSRQHSALAEEVVARLHAVGGWEVKPEVSFAIYGERGVVDLLAWHQAASALLVIELKTEIVDVGELLGTLDRKRRLGAQIAATVGWLRPSSVSFVLLIADGRTNQRRVAAHAATFRAALPDDGRRFRSYLRSPDIDVRALAFLPDLHRGTVRRSSATPRRVRVAATPRVHPEPSVARDKSASRAASASG